MKYSINNKNKKIINVLDILGSLLLLQDDYVNSIRQKQEIAKD